MDEPTVCELRLTETERCFLGNAIVTFREEHGHRWKDSSLDTAKSLLEKLGIKI